MKRYAPATLRNREAIAEVLANELPKTGRVLEIASGSGEHAVYFAERFPQLQWLPTDSDHDALLSIAAYRAEYAGTNLLEPIGLDAACSNWRAFEIDAIFCANMVHISPWAVTKGLFAEAERKLEAEAPIILYGPYFEEAVEPAQSNIDFDLSLRARDERWGIRVLAEIDRLASRKGFHRSARHEMPANNLTLVYRRLDEA